MKYLLLLVLVLLVMFACDKVEEPLRSSVTPKTNLSENIINDEIGGIPIVIYGNGKKRFLTAFQRIDENGKEYTFERSDLSFPFVFKDNEGEIWSIFGTKKENDNLKLENIDFLVGYWFSFPAFNNQILFNDGTSIINESSNNPSSDWLIDRDFVFSGSIKDGIRSIDHPKFLRTSSKEYLQDEFYSSLDGDQLLTVVQLGNETHVYPHRILEYHEIVNDIIAEQPIAVSYCPLTGTSRAWIREIDGEVLEFGVSGLLYNNNLILYDRLTDSNWSQIVDRAVNGPMIGKEVSTLNVFEITIADIPTLSGRIKILSTDTGIDYAYQFSIYKEYPFNDRTSFPLSFTDDRIPLKERVLGVTIDEVTKVYRFSDF